MMQTRINFADLQRQAKNICDSLPRPSESTEAKALRKQLDELKSTANEVAIELRRDAMGEAKQALARAIARGDKATMAKAEKQMLQAMIHDESCAGQLELLALQIAEAELQLEDVISAAVDGASHPWWDRAAELKQQAFEHDRQAEELKIISELVSRHRSIAFRERVAKVMVQNGGPSPVAMPPVVAADAVRRGSARYVEAWRQALHSLDTAPEPEETEPVPGPHWRIPTEIKPEWRSTDKKHEATKTASSAENTEGV